MDEFTALACHRTKALKVVIARLFNTIGPGRRGIMEWSIPDLSVRL
jgi:UDP-glucose 4-epimerase